MRKAQTATEAFQSGLPKILLIAPPSIGKGYEDTFVANEMGNDCAEKSCKLAYYYKRTAELTGCFFLDAGKISGIKMHSNDFMHLDKDSHRRMAKRLAELIPDFF